MRTFQCLLKYSLCFVALSPTFAKAQEFELPEIPAGCRGSTVDIFGPTKATAARSFLVALQTALRKDDRKLIASMVAYPLRLRLSGDGGTIRNRVELLSKYSTVFSPKVKQAILGQSAKCLFGNWQGAMVG